MTSIHDDGPGSSSDEVSLRFQRLHQQLMASQDELESVLATSRTGWCRLTADLAMVTASREIKAALGRPAGEDLTWDALLACLRPVDRGPLTSAVQAAFAGKGVLDLEVEAQPAGQPPLPLALRGRIAPGGIPGLLLTAQPLAPQEGEQGLAAERRAREEAEAAGRAKDELLSVISHELRTPLMSILGWTRILALKCRDDPEMRDIPPRIERGAQNQLKIVNDITDLVRMQSGRLSIEPRPLRLTSLVEGAIEQARATATTRGITLEAQLAAGCELRGDPERLSQVVSNLLSNALKFTPSGGTVTVSLARDQGSFTLTVADTGKGIEARRLPHLFDFVRLRQAAAGEGAHVGGLGLGLTLVHEIVSLHGGTVSAHSAGPGTGATFAVSLPTAPSGSAQGGGGAEGARSSASDVLRRSGHLKGLTVLVVDDDADARALVAHILRQEGAQVTISDGGIAAYEQLKARPFDIVVTDIGMPGMDGYALVRALRNLARGSRALAIAVTGFVGRSDVAAARDAGFDLHFPKPLDLGVFVPMVRRLVRQ